MLKADNVLILNGSPKKEKSTTHSIGEYLKSEFIKKDITTEVIRISSYLYDDIHGKELVSKVDSSNILFIIFPLYIDSLPYNVIQALELIKKYSDPEMNDKKVIAISHSGLQADHNRVAIRICESFSKELNYSYSGGLTLGTSSIINGLPLTSLNRMTKNVQKALTITVDAVAAGGTVPLKAQKLMSKPMLTSHLFLFKIIGNSLMNRCYKNKSIDKGIGKLQNILKVFYS